MANINSPRFQDESIRDNEMIAYVLMTLGLYTGVFWCIGGIWAYKKRDLTSSSHYADHYKNIITTFWGGLAGFTVGALLFGTTIGHIILIFTWFWSIYHITRGMMQLSLNKGYRE